jgi:magnesium chelatase family protein
MSFKNINSAVVVGLNTKPINIEVNIDNRGFPKFEIVGLAAKEISESRERIKAAIRNSGFNFPNKKIIVNLAPADFPKAGALYDVPIALGILAASGILTAELNDYLFVGELSLNGNINKISGATLFGLEAKSKNKILVIPESNLFETNFIAGLKILTFKNLKDLVSALQNKNFDYKEFISIEKLRRKNTFKNLIEDINGHAFAKRALTIAATGRHNICLIGSAGSGKTLLAQSLHSLLPDLLDKDLIDVMKINSITEEKLSLIPNFRMVNNPISQRSLLGGGSPFKLGEITLAHKGILFIDEYTEIENSLINCLRKPVEDKKIQIYNKKQILNLPCDFMLVICANPCPCGNFGDSDKKCICTEQQIKKYLAKLQNPLMDRVDIFINIFSVSSIELLNKNEQTETSQSIKNKITELRSKQISKFENLNLEFKYNADFSQEEIKNLCNLEKPAIETLNALHKKFSSRSVHKILKVSRTIADIEDSEIIKNEHLLEAIQYKSYLN